MIITSGILLIFPWNILLTKDIKFTKDDLFDSPKYILIGAATGAAMLTSNLISDAYSDKRELGYTDFDESRIISSGLTGALLGAIVYPIYTYFDISFGIGTGENIKEHSKMYPINQIGLDYKIEIKNWGNSVVMVNDNSNPNPTSLQKSGDGVDWRVLFVGWYVDSLIPRWLLFHNG